VCRQRNSGIQRASGDFVLLADDDVEFAPEYLATILAYLRAHPGEGALSGMQRDRTDDETRFPDQVPLRTAGLLWSFLFQTSVWGNIDALQRHVGLQPVARFYARRGNSFSLAGWPLLTSTGTPAFRAAVYGLGAAVIRREWLLASPYDERLDTSGIGDHYGVALRFPGTLPVVVLEGTSFLHHRSQGQRLPRHRAYMLRVVALDRFMAESPRFHFLNRVILRWSLFGSALGFLLTGSPRMAVAAGGVLVRLMFNVGRGRPAH